MFKPTRMIVLAVVAELALLVPAAWASHAHLNYSDWWKPAYETEILVSPPPPDAEARAKAFAERNTPANIEKLAKEFFAMLDLNRVRIEPKYIRLDSWGRNEKRPDYQGQKTPVVDLRELVKAGNWQGALDAYRDFFFERLQNPPPGFKIEAKHPTLRQFVEFIHQPDELLKDNVARFTMLDKDKKGAVIRLNMGAPGVVNWTWYPPAFETYDWMVFPKDGTFMARCTKHPIFYNSLLTAYMERGDKQYLDKWCAFMDDRALNLASNCQAAGIRGGPDNQGSLGSAMGTFANLMAATKARPEIAREFSAATLARLLIDTWKAVPTNMRMTRETSSNRSIDMYSTSYFDLGVSFPEFAASQYAIREKMRVVESFPTITMMPDGSDIENAENYNAMYVSAVAGVWKTLQDLGSARPAWITPDWVQELKENMNLRVRYRIHHKGNFGWEWYPNYYTSSRYAGDFAGASPIYLTTAPEALVEPDNRKIISTLWGDGSAGAPDFTSEYWPYSGQALIRENWGRNAQQLYMNSPRPYNSHTWKNANDIQLFAFGQPLLTLHTEGYGFRRAGYAEDPNYSEWEEGYRKELREKYKNPNLRGLYQWEFTPLFVDGLPQMGHEAFKEQSLEFRSRPSPMYGRGNMAYQTPLKNRWHESDRFNLAEGEYAGPFASVDGKKLVEGVSHRRQLIFLRQLGLWIVLDRADSATAHRYKLDWKPAQPFETDKKPVPGFTAAQVLSNDADKSVKTANPDTANISIYMHSPAELKMYQYGAEFAGTGPQLVVSALYPRRTLADELRAIKTIRGKDGATGFEAVAPDGTRVLCQAAADPAKGGALAVEPLQATGEALVLVICPDGTRYGLALGCQNLTVNGQKQVVPRPDFEFSLPGLNTEHRTLNTLPIYRPMDRVTISPASDRFMDTVDVSMTHNEQDTEIRYTLDGSDPTLASPLYEKSFTLRGTTMVKATAFRKGLKEMPQTVSSTLASVPIRAYYVKRDALKPENPLATQPGLNYSYYEGDWSMGGQMVGLSAPSKRGTVKELLELPHRKADNAFLYDYQGYLTIPADGVYTFHAPWEMITPTQDAGYDLRLWLGKEEWYPTTRWHNYGGWSVPLKAGRYPFRVVYVDQRGSEMVGGGVDKFGTWKGEKPQLLISGPGIKRQPIPAGWLCH